RSMLRINISSVIEGDHALGFELVEEDANLFRGPIPAAGQVRNGADELSRFQEHRLAAVHDFAGLIPAFHDEVLPSLCLRVAPLRAEPDEPVIAHAARDGDESLPVGESDP